MDNLYSNILKKEKNVNIKFIEASKSKDIHFFINPSLSGSEVKNYSDITNFVDTLNMENVNTIYIKKTEEEILRYKKYLDYLDLICKAAKAINSEHGFIPDWSGNNTGMSQKKYFLYYSYASGTVAIDYTYEYMNSPLPPCVHFRDQTTVNNFISRLRNELQYVLQYQFEI